MALAKRGREGGEGGKRGSVGWMTLWAATPGGGSCVSADIIP